MQSDANIATRHQQDLVLLAKNKSNPPAGGSRVKKQKQGKNQVQEARLR